MQQRATTTAEPPTAPTPPNDAAPRSARLATAAAVALFVVGLIIVSQGRVPLAPRMAGLVLLLFEQGVVVIAYLAAAAGWGTALGRVIREPALDAAGFAGRLILGLGLMALIMWLLGWAGQLNAFTAWGLGTVGWALAGWQTYQARDHWWLKPSEQWPTLPWPVLLAIPAVTLLIGAACIPPGILWSSEEGGYDVLSYHLQLPKEWIAAGAVQGYAHNVYSYLPNLFEVAFAQLGLWRGSMVDASYTAQLLHACMAILTAVVIGQLVASRTTQIAGALAGGLYLAVPWTIVTGTLAYNEQAVAAFAALAFAVALHLDRPAAEDEPERSAFADGRRGAVVGAFVGLAVLTKLTAVGVVALPLAFVLMMNRQGGRNRQLIRLAGFGLAAGSIVSLWLIRNALWTGNPVFPMLTGLFGTGHWTAEQADRWSGAHHSTGLFAGLAALGRTALWHGQFAFVLWPLLIAAAVVAWRQASTRRTAKLLLGVLAIQLIFWLLFTHHQSRFLVALLLPACLLIGLSWPAWRSAAAATTTFALALTICTVVSFTLYLTQLDGGAARYIDTLNVLRHPESPLPTPFNQVNRHVPPNARIYAEAFATPYYIDRPISYHTAWDASPLGRFIVEDRFDSAHQWLADQGYTHVVIAWDMLDIWREPGNYGYDSNVDPDQLHAFAEQALTPVEQVGIVQLTILYAVRQR